MPVAKRHFAGIPLLLLLSGCPAGPAGARASGPDDAPGPLDAPVPLDAPHDLARSDDRADPADAPSGAEPEAADPSEIPYADDTGPDRNGADVPDVAFADPAAEPSEPDVANDQAADDPASDPGPVTFAPAPYGCVTSIGTGNQTFACDGLDYSVSVPPQCLQSSCGAILDIHGLTMSAEMQDRNTNMRALGAQHGFVVIQPSANPAPPASSWKTGEDDQRILSFLADVRTAYRVDAGRIHVTGFSQGGLMTWRFICKHADLFASAAPGASCNYPTQEACLFGGSAAPSRPIPVLYMHGKDDGIYQYLAAEAQRDAVVAFWQMQESATLSSDQHHAWTRYTAAGGAWFEFVRHDYNAKSSLLKGHCYPGSTDPGDAPGQLFSFRCDDEAAFTWGEIVVQFFVAHPMPP